ncbi:MAG TPA: hypothetical protein VK177_21865 [Flavobacteriales bacterium]|nr:hypothetical protein [Flavobacteriales bacterium]
MKKIITCALIGFIFFSCKKEKPVERKMTTITVSDKKTFAPIQGVQITASGTSFPLTDANGRVQIEERYLHGYCVCLIKENYVMLQTCDLTTNPKMDAIGFVRFTYHDSLAINGDTVWTVNWVDGEEVDGVPISGADVVDLKEMAPQHSTIVWNSNSIPATPSPYNIISFDVTGHDTTDVTINY